MAKRRRNGEGTIVKLVDGRWQGLYCEDDGRRPAVYGRTYQGVRQQLTAAVADVDRGLPVQDEALTVARLLEGRFQVKVRTVRPLTHQSCEGQ